MDDSRPLHVFGTGATRSDNRGKGRFDLIPPYSLRRVAQHYENGARSRGDRNWEKGIPLSRFINSALGHINDFADGKRQEDHLSAAVWNLLGYMHTEREIREGRLPSELADVPWGDSVNDPRARLMEIIDTIFGDTVVSHGAAIVPHSDFLDAEGR